MSLKELTFAIFIYILVSVYELQVLTNDNLYSYRMSLILSGYDLRLCTNKEYIIIHNNIVAAVDMHRRAIELVYYLKFSHAQTVMTKT